MFVDLEPTVKSRITNLSVPAQEALLEIHLYPAESSQNKIFVLQTHVGLELDANQELTDDLEVTDQSVLVPLASEEIPWSPVLEENVRMTVNAQQAKPASTSNVRTPAQMHVVLVPNARLSIMVLYVLVLMDTLVTP